MDDYVKRVDDDGDPIECECCYYHAATSLFANCPTESGARDIYLCEVCAGTHFSKAVTYPRQVVDPQMFQSLGYVANMILDAIKSR